MFHPGVPNRSPGHQGEELEVAIGDCVAGAGSGAREHISGVRGKRVVDPAIKGQEEGSGAWERRRAAEQQKNCQP